MALQSPDSRVTASTKSWDSDTDSNPIFRDPTHRLRRHKATVISAMYSLYNQGPEGQAVLQKDELSFRGWQNPVMQDGTSTPDDIEYWKVKGQYFTEEWRRIDAKLQQNKTPRSRMFGLAADRIYDWITTPADQVAHNDGSEREMVPTSCVASPDQADERSRRLRRRTMGMKLPTERVVRDQTPGREATPTSYIASPCQTIAPQPPPVQRLKSRAMPDKKQRSPPATSRLLRPNVTNARCKKAASQSQHEVRRSRRLANKLPEYGMLFC